MQKKSITIRRDLILLEENYRKTYSQEALVELSESIKQFGILQTITICPHKSREGYYELIAGQRRLIAAEMAGQEFMPTILITGATDSEILEMRLIENLQREDVHPLEEAKAFMELALQGCSYKKIAASLSKKEKYIVQCLSLNELTSYWKTMFREGVINMRAALAIARLSKDNQETLEPSFPREVHGRKVNAHSAASIEQTIQRRFFLDLSKTDFSKDDVDLYPSAGSCTSCSKHTGYNRLLFSEIDKEDYCMDKACFDHKNKQHFENQKKQLQEQNLPVVELSTVFDADPSVLTKSQVEIIEDPALITADCKRVIIKNGTENIGKILHVRMKKADGLRTVLDVAGQVQKRKESLRKQKVEKRVKELSAEKLISCFSPATTGSKAQEAILNLIILERMGNGHSKEFIDHFSSRYGWKVPVNRMDYDNRSRQIAINVENTPVERKIEMLVDLFIFPKALEENSSKVIHMAKNVGIDTESLWAIAGAEVDGSELAKDAVFIKKDLSAA